MTRHPHILAATFLFVIFAGAQQIRGVDAAAGKSNKALVEQSFQDWQDGRGSPFTLLSEDIRWTIAGSSPFAGTYARDAFVNDIVAPFNQRMAAPLKPTRWDVYQDGSMVVIQFDAEAPLVTGAQYRNSYAWFFAFDEGQVTEVTAFLDMPAFEAVMALD